MNLRSIKSSLPLLVGLLLEDAREWLAQSGTSLRVTFGGDESFASGNGQINFQSIPVPSGTADAEFAEIVDTYVALAVHEVGHLEHSDYSIRPSSRLEHVIANILEDRRVDALQLKRWPGFKSAYHTEASVLLRNEPKVTLTAHDTDATVMLHYLLMRSWADQLGHEGVRSLAVVAATEVERRFGVSIRAMLDTHAKLAPLLGSTEEVYQAATELVSLLEAASQEPPQPAESEAISDSDSPDGETIPESYEAEAFAGEDDASQGGLDDVASESLEGGGEVLGKGEPGDDESAPEGGGLSDKADTTQGGSSDRGQPDAEKAQGSQQRQALRNALADDSAPDLAGLLREAANASLAKSIEEGVSAGDVETISLDPGELQMNGASQRELPPVGTMPDLDGIRASTALLRNRLALLLEAESDTDTARSASGRKLVPSGPTRAMLGDPRIFSKPTEGISLSNAISILLDVSGSMDSGGRLEVAVEAALAAAMALQSFDETVLAISVFPGNGRVKSFDETFRQALPRFGLSTWGSTPMAEAMLVASTELVTRDEARKILIVITDGEPDSVTSARAVVGCMRAAQVQCVGIGIQLPAIENIFPNSRVIQAVSELPEALMSTLRSQILAA